MFKKIGAENIVYQLSPDNKPALSCQPGEKIVFVTKDCFSNQINTEEQLFETTDWDTINPATGPLEIQGARAGDVLKVTIEEIKVAEKGVMVAVPGMGLLDKFIKKSQTRVIPIQGNLAVFNDRLKLPINPMIGVIGTAPAAEAVPCGTPGTHGGNMDTAVITAGSVLYLPVWVEGGMLALGDLHALMGDGEVVICGIEIAGEVTLQVDLIPGKSLANPVVETNDAFYTIASAVTLDEAARKAAENMFEFLQARLPLPENELAMLMSLICDLQVSQVVDPEKTARMRVNKEPLKEYKLGF